MSKLPTDLLGPLIAPNFIENDCGVRIACDLHLERLGLTWKSPRVKAFLSRCCGWPDAILADATDEMLWALLEKLKAER